MAKTISKKGLSAAEFGHAQEELKSAGVYTIYFFMSRRTNRCQNIGLVGETN